VTPLEPPPATPAAPPSTGTADAVVAVTTPLAANGTMVALTATTTIALPATGADEKEPDTVPGKLLRTLQLSQLVRCRKAARAVNIINDPKTTYYVIRNPIHGLKTFHNQVVGIVEAPAGAGSFILTARTTPNLIELAAGKALEYFKEEGLDEVIDWRVKNGEANRPSRERYSKFAKALLVSEAGDDYYKQEIGFPIEIVPEVDPYAVHPDGLLPVRVLFRGKPAAGIQLEAAWAGSAGSRATVIGRTDTEGRITVPITGAGNWRLHSLKMGRCADRAVADWESFWASLYV